MAAWARLRNQPIGLRSDLFTPDFQRLLAQAFAKDTQIDSVPFYFDFCSQNVKPTRPFTNYSRKYHTADFVGYSFKS